MKIDYIHYEVPEEALEEAKKALIQSEGYVVTMAFWLVVAVIMTLREIAQAIRDKDRYA